MVPLLFSGFLYSMRTAAALVRNEIATVIAVMKRVTPADEKWTGEVAELEGVAHTAQNAQNA